LNFIEEERMGAYRGATTKKEQGVCRVSTKKGDYRGATTKKEKGVCRASTKKRGITE
jgi:hypothetical protein